MANYQQNVPSVKARSRQELIRLGSRVALGLYPEHVRQLQPMPVAHLFEFGLPKHFQISTGVSGKLPMGVEGVALPRGLSGQSWILLRESVYEELCEDRPRARFTAAHECAHGILHLQQLETRLVHGAQTALFRRRDIPAYLDPEWQSNVFAGAFLLPTSAVLAFVNENGADSVTLAEAFHVSASAAETRLFYMRKEGLIT